ncbi:MAG: division/cell wall cluster transcriptional repressor MraZ [Coriobacteriia bacterium]|nr:division/cell wall cluster transcriptional repressor MraZ [Coriobacteriia bacterium]
MFTGEYSHTMDAKGRVSLPAKFRNALPGEVMLVKSIDEACLWLFTKEDYEAFIGALRKSDAYSARVRRFFAAGTEDCEIDSAGRIRIGQALRTYASLTKDITITGSFDRIELWDTERWSRYSESFDFDSLTTELDELGKL